MQLKTLQTLGLIALASLGIALGGCNKDKDKVSLLETENEQLRAENSGLKDTNSSLTAQNQQLLSDIANRQPAQPSGGYDAPYGGGTPSGGGGGGGGGGGSTVTRLTVAGDVLFPSGKDTLTSGGKKELDKVANTIKSKYSGNRIRVEGYTDSDPIKKSNWASNEALSAARAAQVEKYLISRGVSGSRIESVGMGSAKPKSSKAASRRVEIVILR